MQAGQQVNRSTGQQVNRSTGSGGGVWLAHTYQCRQVNRKRGGGGGGGRGVWLAHTYQCRQVNRGEEGRGVWLAHTYQCRQVNRKRTGGGGRGIWLATKTHKIRSLVYRLRGMVWFWVEFWTGILLQYSIHSMEAYSTWQGPDGQKCITLETFSFSLKSKNAGVSKDCNERDGMYSWSRSDK